MKDNKGAKRGQWIPCINGFMPEDILTQIVSISGELYTKHVLIPSSRGYWENACRIRYKGCKTWRWYPDHKAKPLFWMDVPEYPKMSDDEIEKQYGLKFFYKNEDPRMTIQRHLDAMRETLHHYGRQISFVGKYNKGDIVNVKSKEKIYECVVSEAIRETYTIKPYEEVTWRNTDFLFDELIILKEGDSK